MKSRRELLDAILREWRLDGMDAEHRARRQMEARSALPRLADALDAAAEQLRPARPRDERPGAGWGEYSVFLHANRGEPQRVTITAADDIAAMRVVIDRFAPTSCTGAALCVDSGWLLVNLDAADPAATIEHVPSTLATLDPPRP